MLETYLRTAHYIFKIKTGVALINCTLLFHNDYSVHDKKNKKELKKNDKVYFKSKTGEGSIVEVKSKGHYFMPAKANMRLKGRAQPLINNEVFT